MEHQTKQCGGLIAHFVGDNITCVRDSKTGKFVTKATWKKATEKQALAKAYAVIALQPINKGYSRGYSRVNRGNSVLSFVIIGALLAVLTILLMPVISERQAHYNEVNNSNELLTNYYSDCSTDSDCEQLESQLNFDFKKGMN